MAQEIRMWCEGRKASSWLAGGLDSKTLVRNVPGNGRHACGSPQQPRRAKNRTHGASWVCQRKMGTGGLVARDREVLMRSVGIETKGPFPRRKQDSGLFHMYFPSHPTPKRPAFQAGELWCLAVFGTHTRRFPCLPPARQTSDSDSVAETAHPGTNRPSELPCLPPGRNLGQRCSLEIGEFGPAERDKRCERQQTTTRRIAAIGLLGREWSSRINAASDVQAKKVSKDKNGRVWLRAGRGRGRWIEYVSSMPVCPHASMGGAVEETEDTAARPHINQTLVHVDSRVMLEKRCCFIITCSLFLLRLLHVMANWLDLQEPYRSADQSQNQNPLTLPVRCGIADELGWAGLGWAGHDHRTTYHASSGLPNMHEPRNLLSGDRLVSDQMRETYSSRRIIAGREDGRRLIAMPAIRQLRPNECRDARRDACGIVSLTDASRPVTRVQHGGSLLSRYQAFRAVGRARSYNKMDVPDGEHWHGCGDAILRQPLTVPLDATQPLLIDQHPSACRKPKFASLWNRQPYHDLAVLDFTEATTSKAEHCSSHSMQHHGERAHSGSAQVLA
ncbi:uncharacterized protein MYCFIDRAFT_171412 [Pseudocercospora fijiensis CIRAD86]|uniref:Uncharacterized protein n=1 Tax=Pseudocercospora fijiensis (strain CIRAD86) TaxID=383855 RepID=M3A2T6_PSEFD|nr:uncharacterized protein MYCFIDRAFT_171412 [Pseudocercospora fijiensis CIRAD86]EME85484.1 hypothetical protein MYCFIDRAFT_171412 [Pseudocercospora fijiensis CIRAD86]